MPRLVAILALTFLASGCANSACSCPGCPVALRLEITHPTDASPEVRGSPELSCSGFPIDGWTTMTTCLRGQAEPGSYSYEIALAGHPTPIVTVEAVRAPAAGGCCACSYLERTARVSFGVGPLDGGVHDAGARADASDASSGDAGLACDPERVEFEPSGELAVGTLCDDVFACVPDAAAAAALEAASPVFDCTSEGPGEPCAAASVRCAYRDPGGPSILDAAELARVCAVTALEPPPERIVCRVYM